MRSLAKAPIWLAAAAVITLVGTAASPARAASVNDLDAAVSCSDFERWGSGGWTATAPVTLNVNNGTTLRLAPGQSMGPGSTVAGVPVPVILDRHCGNM
jgi:hypothetical protein